jgi:hypothetical protein
MGGGQENKNKGGGEGRGGKGFWKICKVKRLVSSFFQFPSTLLLPPIPFFCGFSLTYLSLSLPSNSSDGSPQILPGSASLITITGGSLPIASKLDDAALRSDYPMLVRIPLAQGVEETVAVYKAMAAKGTLKV